MLPVSVQILSAAGKAGVLGQIVIRRNTFVAHACAGVLDLWEAHLEQTFGLDTSVNNPLGNNMRAQVFGDRHRQNGDANKTLRKLARYADHRLVGSA